MAGWAGGKRASVSVCMGWRQEGRREHAGSDQIARGCI